jgi:post-segregation antitoxin (ccd killing protein)
MPWKHTRFHMEGSMASRRLFLGSVAAAGVGAAGAATLLEFPASAQNRSSALILELRRQLKEGFEKMQMGQSAGGRQLATILRVYASTVDDGLLRTSLAKLNRQQLLTTEMNHAELVRQAQELGLNASRLPAHSLDRAGREKALDRVLAEGLSPMMLRVADYVDGVAVKMERLERDGRARPVQIALSRQGGCGDCSAIEGAINDSEQWMEVICAAAVMLPYLTELCAAACGAWLTFLASYAVCLEIIAICQAIYG